MGCHTWFKRAVNREYIKFLRSEGMYDSMLGEYVRGKGYFIDVDEYHDLFRVGGYPDDCLFSLDATMKFIQENGCELTEENKVHLHAFWEKYPDGMIRFG